MPRRPATITQADVARVIRAAKQEGAAEVEVRVGDPASILIRIAPSTKSDPLLQISRRKYPLMDVMTRPRPPYLHRVTTRHGKMVWYVRPGVGARKRVRLRSEFGTEEFRVEYEAALSGAPLQTKGAQASGTLAWLIERYREVGAWTSPLARHPPATREHLQTRF